MAAVAGAACVAALVAVVLLATSAGGSSGGYTVRAIFDDAGNLTSGEDVKIDGVKVGTVGSVTPTPQPRRRSCSTSKTRASRTSARTPAARSARRR